MSSIHIPAVPGLSLIHISMGKAKEGCFLGALRQGICFVPAILILPRFWGLKGILYSQPAADVLSAFITIFMAVRLHKELASERKQFVPTLK